ncbi:hypothetical protein [Streptomyces apocyni]|uniref:hypothetical protein n=1 Tax=Streptomyces apocyni TaxID=2654677 RepID=UPI0012EA68B1|nr:hypothetical protein [Streptomyces apocyni]
MMGTAKRPACWIRATAALTLSLGVLTIGAGTATASPSAPTASAAPTTSAAAATSAVPHAQLPGQAVQALCGQWLSITERLPDAAAPVQVCKLVNGWD